MIFKNEKNDELRIIKLEKKYADEERKINKGNKWIKLKLFI